MKLVFTEPGSALAAELWNRAQSVVSSQLVYPEARAAVAAAHRGRRISSGYDAVHLATALSIDADPVLLATWDSDLARAALAAGCSVAPAPPRR